VRGFAIELYGIPRERVIGSTVAYRYLENMDRGEILQKAELELDFCSTLTTENAKPATFGQRNGYNGYQKRVILEVCHVSLGRKACLGAPLRTPF
jgi:hypothetical protein